MRAKAFLFLTTFVLPFAVNAAGLGRLSVTSAQGQPFRAEIDLVAVKQEEKSSLSASLAPQETFRQANVDYLPLLSTFKATVETRPDGLPYVKIVSSQPIAEPLLNILIELNWSSGRLLREYTVVLSQAEHDAQPPAKPVTQAHSTGSAKVEPAADKTVEKTYEKSLASVKHDEKTPVAAEPARAAGKAPAVYGPVKQGDTLGGIAKDIALPTGTSFNQMLVALHRANSDAFIDGNMHQLKAGPVLKIPGSNEITAISPVEANKEIQTQTADWNRRRFPPVVEVPEELKQTVTGKIDRTADADSIAAREPAKEILKLSKGAEPWNDDKDASNMGVGPGPISGEKQPEQSAAQDRLQAMEEDAAAKSRALREANERIALLEKNIRELQQLLELKNAALAEMQKRTEAGQPGAAPVSIPSAAVSPQPESNLQAGMAAQAPAPPAAELSSPGTETDGMELPAAEPENFVNTDEPVEIAKPVQLAKPVLEPPLGTDAGARANAKGTSTIIDDLVANFEYLGGALALLITGIVGVSMVRAPKSQLLFDSDEDNIPKAELQFRQNAQEASLSPRENTLVPAHEAEPVPFTEARTADTVSIGTGLSMSEAQSSEIIKDESAERSTRWHEIINKIDLARAYQEMGDKDAARQILQEVIQEGDVRQQESARLMLGNL
jgi:pilus assembly protein FimV